MTLNNITPEKVIDSLIERGVIPLCYREVAIFDLDRELRKSVKRVVVVMARTAVSNLVKSKVGGAES